MCTKIKSGICSENKSSKKKTPKIEEKEHYLSFCSSTG